MRLMWLLVSYTIFLRQSWLLFGFILDVKKVKKSYFLMTQISEKGSERSTNKTLTNAFIAHFHHLKLTRNDICIEKIGVL